MTGIATTPRRTEAALIPNGVLGMLMFVACEVMFFAALFSAYMVVSAGISEWPPADQPRLPVATTLFNTLVLLLSGWFLFQSNRSFSIRGGSAHSATLLAYAILCGVFFVGFQGFEWVRLLNYGLTMRSSSYGSFFYLIVGTHALHAIIALCILVFQYVKLKQGRLQAVDFWTMQVFWYFVVCLCPLIFICVYLY